MSAAVVVAAAAMSPARVASKQMMGDGCGAGAAGDDAGGEGSDGGNPTDGSQ